MSYDTTASFSLSFFDAGDNARFASRGNFRTRKFGLRPKVLHFSGMLHCPPPVRLACPPVKIKKMGET